jgi:hypothetical protein
LIDEDFMTLDPERIYNAIDQLSSKVDGLDGKIVQVLIHQKEQNGKVDRNVECIHDLQRDVGVLSDVVTDHGNRIVRLERGEEVEADWQREFRSDAKKEQDWTRDKILELFVKIAPWVILVPLVIDKLI